MREIPPTLSLAAYDRKTDRLVREVKIPESRRRVVMRSLGFDPSEEPGDTKLTPDQVDQIAKILRLKLEQPGAEFFLEISAPSGA